MSRLDPASPGRSRADVPSADVGSRPAVTEGRDPPGGIERLDLTSGTRRSACPPIGAFSAAESASASTAAGLGRVDDAVVPQPRAWRSRDGPCASYCGADRRLEAPPPPRPGCPRARCRRAARWPARSPPARRPSRRSARSATSTGSADRRRARTCRSCRRRNEPPMITVNFGTPRASRRRSPAWRRPWRCRPPRISARP